MVKENTRVAYLMGVLILTVIITAVLNTAGCKKEKPDQTPPRPTEIERAQPQPIAKTPEQSTTPMQSLTGIFGGPQKNLTEVLASAKTWGPAFPAWRGQTAPDFTLTDIAGKEHKLSNYRGKNVMLIFWAPWCGPCRMEVPDLIELRNSVGEDKFVMLGISFLSPMNTEEMVKNFTSQNKLNYPVFAVIARNVPAPYSLVDSIPCSFFIDPQGSIKIATIGLLPLNAAKDILQAKSK